VTEAGRLVPVADTRLHVVERGEGLPLVILHGGPGLDHREFGDYLDPLADRFRLLLVDQRGQGRSDLALPETLTLPRMAEDVVHLGRALELGRYAVLGHSFGAFVALQHAVDFPGMSAATVVSSGVPSSRYLAVVDRNLRDFEPEDLRRQVADSWERERSVETAAEVARLVSDQLPFHFRDPRDPRIAHYEARSDGAAYSPSVLRHFADGSYGAIEVEDRLPEIAQPVLVLGGRHDRACPVEASEAMAKAIPGAELVVFEDSAHVTFVEEQEAYLHAVRDFLERRAPSG